MEHQEIKDLLAAYALDAISPDEKREIDIHLMSCESCRAELADHQAVTAALATAVDPVELPAGFKERVLTAAVGDRATEPSARRIRPWAGLFAAASAALVIVAIIGTVSILRQGDDAGRRGEVVEILAAEGGISLAGDSEVIGRVHGTRFALAGLEEAPEGKTYQLWLMRGDACPSTEPDECELISAGTFDTEEGVALLELDQSAADWEDAAVTVEPEAGSEAPTTDPFIHSL